MLPPYSKKNVAAILGIWAVVAFIASLVAALAFIPIDGSLPGYAMESALLFRLERALAITAALILPALVIGPLLAGALPQRLSSDGIDWGEDRANVVDTLDNMTGRLDRLETALSNITDLNDA